jgi:hypothetical protein
MATLAPPTETNTAPPAALLPPGLHDNDDEDAMLLLKLQFKNVNFEDRVEDMLEDMFEDLGYTYDSNDAETAPPKEMASSENPEVDELLLQCVHDKLKSSMVHDKFNKPGTLMEPPPPCKYEYAPAATEIPPPYELAP